MFEKKILKKNRYCEKQNNNYQCNLIVLFIVRNKSYTVIKIIY